MLYIKCKGFVQKCETRVHDYVLRSPSKTNYFYYTRWSLIILIPTTYIKAESREKMRTTFNWFERGKLTPSEYGKKVRFPAQAIFNQTKRDAKHGRRAIFCFVLP